MEHLPGFAPLAERYDGFILDLWGVIHGVESFAQRIVEQGEGGHIAGSRPKKKKVNPHAASGSKECLGCKQVLSFDNFGTDKGRSDGYASKCKECRRKAANEKYASKKIDRA